MNLSEAKALSCPDDLDQALLRVAEAELSTLSAQQHRRELFRFCEVHFDALYRECLVGHLTGSAYVFDAARGQVLLILHRKLGRWLQPGGHADGEGELALVALSEAIEETGIEDLEVMLPAVDLHVHEIPSRVDVPAHLHFDLRFIVQAPAGAEPDPNMIETAGARWVDLDAPDLSALTDLDFAALGRNRT